MPETTTTCFLASIAPEGGLTLTVEGAARDVLGLLAASITVLLPLEVVQGESRNRTAAQHLATVLSQAVDKASFTSVTPCWRPRTIASTSMLFWSRASTASSRCS